MNTHAQAHTQHKCTEKKKKSNTRENRQNKEIRETSKQINIQWLTITTRAAIVLMRKPSSNTHRPKACLPASYDSLPLYREILMRDALWALSQLKVQLFQCPYQTDTESSAIVSHLSAKQWTRQTGPRQTPSVFNQISLFCRHYLFVASNWPYSASASEYRIALAFQGSVWRRKGRTGCFPITDNPTGFCFVLYFSWEFRHSLEGGKKANLSIIGRWNHSRYFWKTQFNLITRL